MKIIKLSCKNAASIGVAAGLAMSANEITALLTGGEGLVGIPANILIACATIGGELVTLTRVHLKLIADLGNLYGAPLDVDDPEEVWDLILFAFGSSSVESTGGFLAKIAGHWTKLGIKAYFQKETLKFWKKEKFEVFGKGDCREVANATWHHKIRRACCVGCRWRNVELCGNVNNWKSRQKVF